IWEQVGGANGQGIGSPKNSVNGAFVYDHSYDDVTVRLYQGTCGRDCRIKNMLYLGYAEPFALINVTVATGRDGGTATWQYWNGSAWSSLTLGSDSTNGIANTGAVHTAPQLGPECGQPLSLKILGAAGDRRGQDRTAAVAGIWR